MKTQINIKVDERVKRDAQKQAARLGLSLSSVVNATLSQFARTGELELSTSSYKPTPYLISLIEEARREHEEGNTAGPFESAEAMFESLDAKA